MKIGERIKQRRKSLNMSQEELALKVGYKDKTAINKIELGINGIPEKRLKDFANALNTSVSFLIGVIDDQELTSVEEELINSLVKSYKEEFNKIYDDYFEDFNKAPNRKEYKEELLLRLSHDDYLREIGYLVEQLPEKEKKKVYKLLGLKEGKRWKRKNI